MTQRTEYTRDYDEQPVVVEAVPKSTLVVAGALYVVAVGIMGYTASAVIDLSKSVAEMKGGYGRDIASLGQRMESVERTARALDGRVREVERDMPRKR